MENFELYLQYHREIVKTDVFIAKNYTVSSRATLTGLSTCWGCR